MIHSLAAIRQQSIRMPAQRLTNESRLGQSARLSAGAAWPSRAHFRSGNTGRAGSQKGLPETATKGCQPAATSPRRVLV